MGLRLGLGLGLRLGLGLLLGLGLGYGYVYGYGYGQGKQVFAISHAPSRLFIAVEVGLGCRHQSYLSAPAAPRAKRFSSGLGWALRTRALASTRDRNQDCKHDWGGFTCSRSSSF